MDDTRKDSADWWRLPSVLDYTEVSRSTWLNLVKKGVAPKPRALPGTRAVVWKAEEVKAFMDSLEAVQ